MKWYLMTQDEAGTIAAQALRFIAGDEERLARFFSLTGLSSQTIANNAGDVTFLAGILDHLLSDEAMVLEFCENLTLPPQAPAQAQAVLEASQQ